MSNKFFVSLDIELNPTVIQSLQDELIPRALNESQALEDLKSASFQLLKDSMAVEIPMDDPDYNESVFHKKAIELMGFPKIASTYSNLFYYYLKQGNMVQLNYNPELGLYEDVLFVFASSIYYASVRSLGLYRYNVKTNGTGTEAYTDPMKWKKVPLSKKAAKNGTGTTYLRLNLNAGKFMGTENLYGNMYEDFPIFYTKTHAIIWHRLVYFLFHKDVNFRDFNCKSVNHMLGGSYVYLDLIESSHHYGNCYLSDVDVTFAELQSHPMMLELCSSKDNAVHGRYIDNWGFRCIPVSVDWIPDDTEYSKSVARNGKELFNRVLDTLENGYYLRPYVNDVITRCLENGRIF